MNIEIHTKSKSRSAFINMLATIYAHQLNLNVNKGTLHIFTMPGLMKTQGYNGGVYRTPDAIEMVLDSRLSANMLMQTVAHEMVHVKQYAKGQLKATETRGRVKYTWLGKPVKKKHSIYDSPWELEAYGRERILVNEILNIIGEE